MQVCKRRMKKVSFPFFHSHYLPIEMKLHIVGNGRIALWAVGAMKSTRWRTTTREDAPPTGRRRLVRRLMVFTWMSGRRMRMVSTSVPFANQASFYFAKLLVCKRKEILKIFFAVIKMILAEVLFRRSSYYFKLHNF